MKRQHAGSLEYIVIRGEPCRPVLKLHRGGVVIPDTPENSVAALQQAIEWGADMVEIDLRQTRDGYVLLSHDPTFERLCGDLRAVADTTLEEARLLRIAGTDEPLAEFEDVCRVAAGGKIGLTLDIKDQTPALCRRVVELIERYDLRAATIAPGDVPLFWGQCFVMLSIPWVEVFVEVRGELPEGVVVGCSVEALAPDVVGRLHGLGCRCFSAAIEAPGQSAVEGLAQVRRELERCGTTGVDGFIIDTPYFDAAVEVLELPKECRGSFALRG